MRNLLSKTALAVAITFGTCGAWAAQVTGTAAWPGGQFAESTQSSDLHYEDGRAYSDLPVLLICVDVKTHVPPDGPIAFNTGAGGSALKGGSGELGVAAIHWLFDQYYATYFQSGTDQTQWAFQYALWEIGNDFNGSVSSISDSSGSAVPTTDGYFKDDPSFINAYQAIYSAFATSLPSLSPSYRSTNYTLDLFTNADPSEQNMVAVVHRKPDVTPSNPSVPTPVPTLGEMALLILSVAVALLGWGRVRPRNS